MSNTRRAKPSPDNNSRPSPEEIISAAKLPEKSVPICMRGDLVAEFEELDRKLSTARQSATDRLTSGGDARKLAEQLEALRTTMQESTITFRLRAMDRKQWPTFIAEHPPRKDNANDKAMGINQETFFEALIRRSIVEPQLSEDVLTSAFDAMNSAQFDELAQAAHDLNRQNINVPFSALASVSLRNSGEK